MFRFFRWIRLPTGLMGGSASRRTMSGISRDIGSIRRHEKIVRPIFQTVADLLGNARSRAVAIGGTRSWAPAWRGGGGPTPASMF